MVSIYIGSSGNGENVVERIWELPISDDEKKELLAECRKMLRRGDSDRLEKIFELPWGVFSQRVPNVARARTHHLGKWWIVGNFAAYSILLANHPRTRLQPITNSSVDPLFDKEIMNLASDFLGRPVESIRFTEHTTASEFLTSLMNAARRAKCCNPVIVLEDIEKIKNKKTSDACNRLTNGEHSNKSCVDPATGVSFDLSNVLFVRQHQMEENQAGKHKVPMMQWLILPSILADYGLEDRRFLFDQTALQMIASPSNFSLIFIPSLLFTYPLFASQYSDTLKQRLTERLLDELAAFLKKNPNISSQKEVITFLKKKGCKKHNGVREPLRSFQGEMYLPVGYATVLTADVSRNEGYINPMLANFSTDMKIINDIDMLRWSVDIAFNICRKNAEKYGISKSKLENPFTVRFDSAIGRGLSGGCATFIALFSLFTNRRVRRDSAVSGVVNLSGRIQPIGGVGPKTSAAHQWNARRIVLPSGNRKDVEYEVSEKLRKELEFVFVDTVDELIEAMVESEEACSGAPTTTCLSRHIYTRRPIIIVCLCLIEFCMLSVLWMCCRLRTT